MSLGKSASRRVAGKSVQVWVAFRRECVNPHGRGFLWWQTGVRPRRSWSGRSGRCMPQIILDNSCMVDRRPKKILLIAAHYFGRDYFQLDLILYSSFPPNGWLL